ncbi:hypothetical protein [Arthrobacter sp. N1]|uniref:hypothetical protein n=1 Tax=Arthrobacter sp. N1 TaxID=619291 RepID=UPI003BB12A58
MSEWNLHLDDDIDTQLHAAANRGLAIAGEYVLGESNAHVPIEESLLQASGAVVHDPARSRVAVVYDTPYAVRQHEELTYRHDAGRNAKFLENALNDHRTIRHIIASAIRGEI